MLPILHVLAVLVAGWLNERQQNAIEYLREENRVLREQLCRKRIKLNDDQRRRLAAKGMSLGQRFLDEVCTIVTPDTILRWHRELLARKYDSSDKRRVRRRGVMTMIRDLCVRMASENPRWGFKAHCRTLDTRLAARRSDAFSVSTGSNPRRGGICLGGRSFERTGNGSRRRTSSRLKRGRSVA